MELEEAKRILGMVAGRESGVTTVTLNRDAARVVLDALAVFEKAHTPTDDEREALAEVIARERRGWERNGGRVDSMTLRDAILAAGFRRSENPEQLV